MLQDIAREAGRIILDMNRLEVREKGESDFVTQADMAVHDLLHRELPSLLPGSTVMSEEDTHPAEALRGDVWIIDPVDGTSNLIFGLRMSCVSIGLVREGTPVEGLVYNPFSDELFYARRGEGAALNGRPIHVSREAEITNAFVGFESGPHSKHTPERFISMFHSCYTGTNGVRLTGSTALDLAYVACGRFTASYSDWDYPWDIAAGVVLVQEAGGCVTDFDGKTPEFTVPRGHVASNGLIHRQMLELMRSSGRSTASL